MLDLNELERRLDEALARETNESLSEWLLDQRTHNLINFIGDGCFAEIESKLFNYCQRLEVSHSSIYTNVIKDPICDDDFTYAA